MHLELTTLLLKSFHLHLRSDTLRTARWDCRVFCTMQAYLYQVVVRSVFDLSCPAFGAPFFLYCVAFGAHLDVGLAQRPSSWRFVQTLHDSLYRRSEGRSSLIRYFCSFQTRTQLTDWESYIFEILHTSSTGGALNCKSEFSNYRALSLIVRSCLGFVSVLVIRLQFKDPFFFPGTSRKWFVPDNGTPYPQSPQLALL